jgi:hypothetical protein
MEYLVLKHKKEWRKLQMGSFILRSSRQNCQDNQVKEEDILLRSSGIP